MKSFYGHLISVESLIVELDQLDLSEEEKHHLAALIDSSLHHKILDAVLSELGEEEKQKFLFHLSRDEDEKLWELLNSKVDNIEDKIKKAAEDLKSELHKDIKEARQKKDKGEK